MTADIYKYFDAVMAATQNNPRVASSRSPYGKSVLGKRMQFYVLSTPDNIANLDGGRRDAAFWAGVRDGSVSEAAASRRCAPGPRRRGSPPRRTARSLPRARRSPATSTSWLRARTAGTRGG
jgi:hypothetical protein